MAGVGNAGGIERNNERNERKKKRRDVMETEKKAGSKKGRGTQGGDGEER